MIKTKKIIFLLFAIALQSGLFFSAKASGCPNNSSFDDLTLSCKCLSGYIWEGSECVKLNQYCADTFGNNSKYNSTTEKCECSYGYIAYSGQCVAANEYCQNNGGPHSIYDSVAKSCKCDYGYLKNSSDYCVSQSVFCSDMYGDNSQYNKSTKKCECQEGYILSGGNCIDGNKYCQSKMGSHSGYDIALKSCACDLDYKLKNSKCSAIEILSISSNSGFAGDEVKIIGNNFGKDGLGQKLYIGADLIDAPDIISWKDDEIIFKIEEGFQGGNIILETSDGTNISGPNFSVSVKTETSGTQENKTESAGDSGKITLNQQINITGQHDSQPAKETSNAVTTTVATNESKPKGGVFSFMSGFLGSVLDGFKSLFNGIFGNG